MTTIIPDDEEICTDMDGDGYATEGNTCGHVDCDDTDASIHPGAIEICGDGMIRTATE